MEKNKKIPHEHVCAHAPTCACVCGQACVHSKEPECERQKRKQWMRKDMGRGGREDTQSRITSKGNEHSSSCQVHWTSKSISWPSDTFGTEKGDFPYNHKFASTAYKRRQFNTLQTQQHIVVAVTNRNHYHLKYDSLCETGVVRETYMSINHILVLII